MEQVQSSNQEPVEDSSHLKRDESDSDEDDQEYEGALKVTKIRNRRYIRMPNFAKRQVNVLKSWLQQHIDNPYPTHREKEVLSKESGLSKKQIQNWFTNARKRIWQPMVKTSEKQEISTKLKMDSQQPTQDMSSIENASEKQRKPIMHESIFQNSNLSSNPHIALLHQQIQCNNNITINPYGLNNDLARFAQFQTNQLGQSYESPYSQIMAQDINQVYLNTMQQAQQDLFNMKSQPLRMNQSSIFNTQNLQPYIQLQNQGLSNQQLMSTQTKPNCFPLNPMHLLPLQLFQQGNNIYQNQSLNSLPNNLELQQNSQPHFIQNNQLLKPIPKYNQQLVKTGQATQNHDNLIHNPLTNVKDIKQKLQLSFQSTCDLNEQMSTNDVKY